MTDGSVDLSKYSSKGFDRGRPFWVEWLWRLTSAIFFQSGWFPFYAPKRMLLRSFGARIGRGVLIKPRVTITFPWRVEIGDHVWIGEEAWLDSLAAIRIDSHVCISQGAYLCTGNHDYKSGTFDLRCSPIHISKGAWIAAKSVVGPGVTAEEGAILSLGSVATDRLEEKGIYQGNPARRIATR